MHFFKRFTAAIAAVVFCCNGFQAPAFAANLVTNGDFQSGNTGFSTDYAYTPDANSGGNPVLDAGQYAIDSRAVNVHGAFTANYDHTLGTAQGLYFIANGSSDTSDVVWQMTAPVNVVAGTPYRFEAYLMDLLTWANDQPILIFQLGDGTNWVNLGTTPTPFPHAEWTFIYADGKFNTAGSYFIRLINNQSAGGGNDLGVDDIFFSLRTEAPSYPSNPGVADPPEFDTSSMNSVPEITSGGGGDTFAIGIIEERIVVTTVTASDSNGDTLTYSISGGEDSARFSINSSSGVLSFLTAPDFGNPTDTGADNGYVVEVSVSDGNGGTDAQLITVTILPVIAQAGGPQVSDGAASDYFGRAVAVSGDTAIIGAYFDDDNGDDSGSAFVFTRTDGVWTQQAKLTAADGAANDYFGFSVALSGDTAVIGAYEDDVGATANQGSAYVFTRSNGAWTQQAKLTASDGAESDIFGFSVAISGDTAVVGAQNKPDGTFSGAAYVFTRTGEAWAQKAKLTASDGSASDYFGRSVAISGDTVFVGAPDDDVGASGVDHGSVYVFVEPAGGWENHSGLDYKLTHDGGGGDSFGQSVAASGDTVLVGAPKSDESANADQGSAYLFVKPSGGWASTSIFDAKLTASDGAAGDEFGQSVALVAEMAIVGAHLDDIESLGAAGSAYVFFKPQSGWADTSNFHTRLTAGGSAADDRFGVSVALSTDTALAGAWYDDDNGVNSGSAFVFHLNDYDQWGQQTKLLPVQDDGATGDGYGRSLALSGDTAVVGAVLDHVGANANQGSAYVLKRKGASWHPQARLVADDGASSDIFGISAAISGDTVVVGAQNKPDGTFAGAAYVFTRTGDSWAQQAKLTASDGAASDYFGNSVAVSGDTALVGAHFDDDEGNNSGSAYIFTRSGGLWMQRAKLTAAANGAAGEEFGISVALSGDTAVVGAKNDDGSGAAYVFVGSGASWDLQERLTASDGAASDEFGASVALHDETIVVGAPLDDDATTGFSDQGSAYVFTRSGSEWTQQARLTASDGAAGERFGASVSVSGGTAMVGAWYDDDQGTESGSAYLFKRSGTTWAEHAKLAAASGGAYDQFGIAVAMAGDTALVGAQQNPFGASPSGSGSVFFHTFPCAFGHDIVVSQWSMIAPSCSPALPGTVTSAFGDDLDMADYDPDGGWKLFKADHAAKRYVFLNGGDAVDPGIGLWVKSYDSGTLDLDGGNPTPVLGSPHCPSDNGCFFVDLTPPATSGDPERPNLIGHPLSYDVDVADLVVLIDGTSAYGADENFGGYVSTTLQWYSGTAYSPFDDSTPGMSGRLEPFKSFWIRVQPSAAGKDVKLLIPATPTVQTDITMQTDRPLPWYAQVLEWLIPAAQADPGKNPKHSQSHARVNQPGKDTDLSEWYVRLVVEQLALGLRDASNVFGQLADSVDGYDRHDLNEKPPHASPWLTIVFPHLDWGEYSDYYSSDYHGLPKNKSEGDSWIFEVKSDDPGRVLTLSWQGPADILDRSILIDLQAGAEVAGAAGSYEFAMSGQSRRFEWVLAKAAGAGKGGKN